ncbi:type II toxin-antitoxin system RelE/ParE family toxin [Candidatus Sumerlaeota bacterium]|nr:type II toxin-antitoxin system RelE/ParE family toxin [Candidatus Sumerlaeota bacterium]
MASYEVRLKPSVGKDFQSLPKNVRARAWGKIESLARNPLPAGVAKISGAEDVYRLRVGDYRIVYCVDRESREILVQYVRHRKDAYRQM